MTEIALSTAINSYAIASDDGISQIKDKLQKRVLMAEEYKESLTKAFLKSEEKLKCLMDKYQQLEEEHQSIQQNDQKIIDMRQEYQQKQEKQNLIVKQILQETKQEGIKNEQLLTNRANQLQKFLNNQNNIEQQIHQFTKQKNQKQFNNQLSQIIQLIQQNTNNLEILKQEHQSIIQQQKNKILKMAELLHFEYQLRHVLELQQHEDTDYQKMENQLNSELANPQLKQNQKKQEQQDQFQLTERQKVLLSVFNTGCKNSYQDSQQQQLYKEFYLNKQFYNQNVNIDDCYDNKWVFMNQKTPVKDQNVQVSQKQPKYYFNQQQLNDQGEVTQSQSICAEKQKFYEKFDTETMSKTKSQLKQGQNKVNDETIKSKLLEILEIKPETQTKRIINEMYSEGKNKSKNRQKMSLYETFYYPLNKNEAVRDKLRQKRETMLYQLNQEFEQVKMNYTYFLMKGSRFGMKKCSIKMQSLTEKMKEVQQIKLEK